MKSHIFFVVVFFIHSALTKPILTSNMKLNSVFCAGGFFCVCFILLIVANDTNDDMVGDGVTVIMK